MNLPEAPIPFDHKASSFTTKKNPHNKNKSKKIKQKKKDKSKARKKNIQSRQKYMKKMTLNQTIKIEMGENELVLSSF